MRNDDGEIPVNPFPIKLPEDVRQILYEIKKYFDAGFLNARVTRKVYNKLLDTIDERERGRYKQEIPYLNGKIKSL